MAEAPLCLIIESARFRRVHYALALAAAAAAVNRPAILFFTLAACRALTRENGGKPGWHALEGEGQNSPEEIDTGYGGSGLGQFEELLGACRELDVAVMVCDMGLRAEGLSRGDLRDDLTIGEGGIVTLLNLAGPSGQIIVV